MRIRRFLGSVLLAALQGWASLAVAQAVGTISTVAGRGPDSGPLDAILGAPHAVAFDAAGNMYVAERDYHRIRKLTPQGVVSTIAGTGSSGFHGDGGLAAAAQLHSPGGIAVDGAGNVYVSDSRNHRVRRIDAAGVITTLAGTGVPGHSDGSAESAQLNEPQGLSLDHAGALLIADTGNRRVRKLAGGALTTVAGNGQDQPLGDGGVATSAAMQPWDVLADGLGGMYIADATNNRVRRVDAAGTIFTVAGGGSASVHAGPIPATQAALGPVTGLARDASGNLYVVLAFAANTVAVVDADGAIRSFAGTAGFGFGGDGGPALAATLASPIAVAVDAARGVCIADTGNDRVRCVNAGVIDTVFGGGEGDILLQPVAVASTGGGSFAVADAEANAVIAVNVFGGSPIATLSVSAPEALAYGVAPLPDATEVALHVADTGGHRVVAGPSFAAIAGSGIAGHGGDGGPATMAGIHSPSGLAFDEAQNLFIAERGSNRVRRVDRSGAISTVAGNGTAAHSGDGGPATGAGLSVRGIALDPHGNLYIADSANHRVRHVDPGGIIRTIAGTGVPGFAGDGGPATAAQLQEPVGVAYDEAARMLFIAERGNHRIRGVDSSGVITTVAGNGTPAFTGDAGPAAQASLNRPSGIALMADSGTLLIADTGNHRVRAVALGDRVPDAFELEAVSGAQPSTLVSSAPVTPQRYDFPTAVSVTGGEYSIGCDANFTAGPGTISPGQAVCVRHLSAATLDTEASTTLRIGGVSATFRSRTRTGIGTTVTLAASPSSAFPGQPVTFLVSVGDGTPTGTVSIRRGSTILCQATLSSGTASCVHGGFAAGTHMIEADYGGDLVFARATSAPLPYLTHATTSSTLTVTRTGNGTGTVSSSPAGIDCGVTCSATFHSVVEVSLAATPSPGSSFHGWAGACSGFATCTLSTHASASVEARFGLASNQLVINPGSVEFGRVLPGDSAFRTLTLKNVGMSPLAVTGVSVSDAQFAASHDCAAVPPGGTCSVVVTFLPALPSGTEDVEVRATLRVANDGAVPDVAADLSGTTMVSLVDHFYRAILRREPEPGGGQFWRSEASRLVGLGANASETFFVMAGYFFNSPEYQGYARTDLEYVQDLYNTFFNRLPDTLGQGYWLSQMALGMPREVVLFSFMFSPEFRGLSERVLGANPARPEVDLVMDLFRGLLNRLPDTAAFHYWVGRLRTAQCVGPGAVHEEVAQMSRLFLFNPEYAGRERTPTQLVTDMYYAFLRRGGELAGVEFWVDRVTSGALPLEILRQDFFDTPEFNARIAAVIAAGCMP
ncbi:MAG TPA: DUF4214 domain-containing protein [Usitatibacter sp.]|nr:DUF4214 domain-containing protein [Usitatibacter sp.]